MTEKQKTKDGNKSVSDIERMHQILLEMGYYKEEELESNDVNIVNVAPEKTTLDYKPFVSKRTYSY